MVSLSVTKFIPLSIDMFVKLHTSAVEWRRLAFKSNGSAVGRHVGFHASARG